MTTYTPARSVRARRGLAIVVFVSAILLAGCTSRNTGAAVSVPVAHVVSPSASPSPTSTMSAATLEAETDAMTAFNKYRSYEEQVMKSGHFDEKFMNEFTTQPVLGDSIHAFAEQEAAGMTFRGTTSWTPTVVSVDLNGPEPIVKIRDCYDQTNFNPVIGGKPGPHISGPRRMDLTLKVEEIRGVWYVFYEDSTPGKTSC